jgi:glycosyltransferase involved in cell wall biosynthesis
MNEVVMDGRVIRCAQTMNKIAHVTIIGVNKNKLNLNETDVSVKLGLKVLLMGHNTLIYFKETTAWKIWRYFAICSKMIKKILELKPDIIHANDWSTIIVARIAAAKCQAKVVYDAHELYREIENGTGPLERLVGKLRIVIIKTIENWALKNADLIIACNAYRAQIMKEEYGSWMVPIIVPNAVPFQSVVKTDYLKSLFKLSNNSIDVIMLYQGGSSRCIEEILQAVSMPNLSSVGFAMIGPISPSYEDRLNKQIEELGLRNRVLLLPMVSNYELHQITSSADIGIVLYRPNQRNNYYCASNKMYEYSMAGLPIIGGDLPTISDYITKYNCGITVDPVSVEHIYSAIKKLLDDPISAESMKQNALIAAKKESWDVHSEILLGAYNDYNLI